MTSTTTPWADNRLLDDHTLRALGDLGDAEKRLRMTAEGQARALRQILVKLAFRFAGAKLEELRKAEPTVPDYWTAADWGTFWDQVSPELSSKNWSCHTDTVDSARISELESFIADLQKSLQVSRTAEQRLLLDREERNDTRQAVEVQVKLQPHMKNAHPEPGLTPRGANNPGYEPYVAELKALSIPQPVARFEQQLGYADSTLRYRRKMLILYLLAKYGFSARIEVDRIVSRAEGIAPRSNSVRRPAEELGETGLVIAETLEMTSPFKTSLALLRLSEDGKDLARILGWNPVISEWQSLIDGHAGNQEKLHTLCVLIFALQARARGWSLQILPQVEGHSAPDVKVVRTDSYYVEVERGDGSSEKWKNLAELNGGKVVFCAVNREGRSKLIRDCKSLKLPGLATDLASLLFSDDSLSKAHPVIDLTPDDPLWLEEW